jgi:hypothetical protein
MKIKYVINFNVMIHEVCILLATLHSFEMGNGGIDMRRCVFTMAACLLFLAVGAGVHALTIDSSCQGWVNSQGTSNGSVNGNNTFTGNEFGDRYNSWASFDLASIDAGVTSAVLKLRLAPYPDASADLYALDIYDVSTSMSVLSTSYAGVSGYGDLMSGHLYGTVTGNRGLYSVALSSQAIADINATLGGVFVLGFTNATLNSEDPADVDLGMYINGSLEDTARAPQLILNPVPEPVPEPSTLILIGSALLCVAVFRRKMN